MNIDPMDPMNIEVTICVALIMAAMFFSALLLLELRQSARYQVAPECSFKHQHAPQLDYSPSPDSPSATGMLAKAEHHFLLGETEAGKTKTEV